jgi:hypothetical protein
VGEGDRRAVPSALFIEEQIDVQGSGPITVRGPHPAEFALNLKGFSQELIGI